MPMCWQRLRESRIRCQASTIDSRRPSAFPSPCTSLRIPPRLSHALTDGIFRAFPDYPPFEGKFDTVVPHVTVAHGDEPLAVRTRSGVAHRAAAAPACRRAAPNWCSSRTRADAGSRCTCSRSAGHESPTEASLTHASMPNKRSGVNSAREIEITERQPVKVAYLDTPVLWASRSARFWRGPVATWLAEFGHARLSALWRDARQPHEYAAREMPL